MNPPEKVYGLELWSELRMTGSRHEKSTVVSGKSPGTGLGDGLAIAVRAGLGVLFTASGGAV
jgi:hypothetical protein